MARPRLVRIALENVDELMRSINVHQQALVEKIHALVKRTYGTSDSHIFHVWYYDPNMEARVALGFLFHFVRSLQLRERWIASYLWCPVEDVPAYVFTGVAMLRDAPDGEFSQRLISICREIDVDPALLLSDAKEETP